MRVSFSQTDEYDIVLPNSFDSPMLKDFLNAARFSVLFSDSAKKDVVMLSDKFKKEQYKRFADFLCGGILSVQSVFSLTKSHVPVRQLLRHYTVDVNRVFAEKNALKNNQIVLLFVPSGLAFYQATVHINSNIGNENEISLPIAIGAEEGEGIILLKPIPYICTRVRPQKATKIKDDIISINEGLYQELKKMSVSSVDFRHLATGATISRDFSSIDGDPRLARDQIMLNYYQREILNIYDKQKKDFEGFDPSKLQDKVLRTTEKEDAVSIEDDEYNLIQMFPIIARGKKHRFKPAVIPDLLVGAGELNLSAVRPYKIDDSRDIVRLSEDTMTLLGIEESDRVIVAYKNKSCRVRAMKIDSYEFICETNIMRSERDLDLIVGVPAPIRKQLGLGDVETEVSIKRDTVFLFLKNLNIQMLSVLGLLLAVFQIGEGHYFIKSMICIALLPVIIYASLSQERSKVKKYNKKQKT